MFTQEKTRAGASNWFVEGTLIEDYRLPSGYSGEIEETELWDCDILDGEDVFISYEPEVVKVSLQLNDINVETSNEGITELMLLDIAEQQLQQPTIVEVSTQPSEFASNYGEDICALFLQDIAYAVEGHEICDGVTIQSARWEWDEVKVVK